MCHLNFGSILYFVFGNPIQNLILNKCTSRALHDHRGNHSTVLNHRPHPDNPSPGDIDLNRSGDIRRHANSTGSLVLAVEKPRTTTRNPAVTVPRPPPLSELIHLILGGFPTIPVDPGNRKEVARTMSNARRCWLWESPPSRLRQETDVVAFLRLSSVRNLVGRLKWRWDFYFSFGGVALETSK